MPFDPVPPDLPEPGQRHAQPECLVVLSLGREPLQTGAHLFVVRLQLGQQAALVRPEEHGGGAFGHGETMGGVTTARDGEGPGLLQLRQRVLPEGLEHHETVLDVRILHALEEALVHQRAEELAGRVRGEPAHRCRTLHGGAGREDAQGVEEGALLQREEGVAPGDRLPQGLLPALGVVETVPENLKRAGLREALEHRPRTVPPDPGRRQLDGERKSIQSPTELEDVGRVLLRDLEARGEGLRALGKEPHRVVVERLLLAGRFRRGAHPRNGHVVLPRQMKEGSAGDQHRESRGCAEQPGDDRCRRKDVLEVVHDQELLPRPEEGGHHLLDGSAGNFLQLEGGGDRVWDPLRVAHVGEADEAHPLGEVIGQRPGHLDGEPGLARSSRTGEREEAGAAPSQQGRRGGNLPRAAEKRGDLRRQRFTQDGSRKRCGRPALEGSKHIANAGVAEDRLARHARGDHCVPRRVDSGPARRDARGRLGDPEHRGRHGRLAPEGQLAREHLVEDHAQRIDVGRRSDAFPQHLLRGHVARSPDQCLAGHLRVAGPFALQRPGDSEVGDDQSLRGLVGNQQHIGALEIPVDDPLGMCRLQRIDHLLDQGKRLGWSERAGAEPVGEGLALEQLHGEEEEGFPGGLRGEELEDAADVAMGDSPRQENLPAEPFPGRGVIGQGRLDELQCHPGPQRTILCLCHHAHPPASDDAEDLEALVDDIPGPRPGRRWIEDRTEAGSSSWSSRRAAFRPPWRGLYPHLEPPAARWTSAATTHGWLHLESRSQG